MTYGPWIVNEAAKNPFFVQKTGALLSGTKSSKPKRTARHTHRHRMLARTSTGQTARWDRQTDTRTLDRFFPVCLFSPKSQWWRSFKMQLFCVSSCSCPKEVTAWVETLQFPWQRRISTRRPKERPFSSNSLPHGKQNFFGVILAKASLIIFSAKTTIGVVIAKSWPPNGNAWLKNGLIISRDW